MAAKTFEQVLDEVRGKPILVANRGIPARRICRAIRERFAAVPVMTATDIDKAAPAASSAQELLLLGSDPRAYLDLDLIIAKAKQRGIIAIHPGWGFASEDERFPQKCEEAGITFIGSKADSMNLLGNKVQVRKIAKRLGIQLSILGMHPVLISLDDYFVEREKTPRDEKGDYDFEALEAVDVELFNDHLNRLLKGETVRIPRYNFITGKREFHEQPLQMEERSVLVIEGIHGLNPKLTPHVAADMKFKIYVSALTSIAMDNLNRIATTDSRLIRRIVRDHRTRGNSATDTLRRWESVRRGEDKHIFPNQEQADLMFNSSLFYELSVLKDYVRPLLREVPDTVPEFGEAHRLLKFLDHFTSMDRFEAEIPPTSILREFIGGSCFEY